MPDAAFEFLVPRRILFGCGTREEIGKPAFRLGSRCLFVTGSSPQRWADIISRLESGGISMTLWKVGGEPTISMVRGCVEKAREDGCDFVLAMGGGSVLDTAKAASALLTNPGDVLDYLEVVGRALPLVHPPCPLIAVPTTAGTGSEATHNAVIIVEEHGVKVSLRSPLLLPELVVVDPDLTVTVPPSITASTGLDALTQLIEPFVSRASNPITDCLCREGLLRVSRSLRRAYQDGSNREARQDMSLAALLSGMALANAKLGAVHALAAAIGGMQRVPHGLVCASLLPHVMEMNIKTAKASGNSTIVGRFEEVARILTGRPDATAGDGIAWVRSVCEDLGVSKLGEMGIAENDMRLITLKALRASSMKGNPVDLDKDEIAAILSAAW